MSTRASAKQQELEEQMAKLVSMMELQQQRQEQLAREQQQRQEEQFGRLLEEQQQQLGKLFMKQQREAEERIADYAWLEQLARQFHFIRTSLLSWTMPG